MLEDIKKIIRLFFCILFMIFGFGGCIITSAIANNLNLGVANRSELMKKVLDSVEHGEQKQDDLSSDSAQVFDLLKQISDDLGKDKEKLLDISRIFDDLCSLLGKIEDPKRHHIRALKEKIAALDLLISENGDVPVETDEALIFKIRTLILLLRSLLENEDLNLGGLGDLFLDVLYYRPTELVSENKVVFSLLAFVATVATGSWKLKNNNIIWNSFSKVLNDFFKKDKAVVGVNETSESGTAKKNKQNRIRSFPRSRVGGEKVGGHVLRLRASIRRPGMEKRDAFVGGHKLRDRKDLNSPSRYFETDKE